MNQAISMLDIISSKDTAIRALSLRAFNFTNPELDNLKIEQFFKKRTGSENCDAESWSGDEDHNLHLSLKRSRHDPI
jgi:hypothetical protein